MDFSAKMLRDEALKGKVIVVTGGGSGLGKAMTRYFMELGAKVAITCLLYTSPSPRDRQKSRMPSSA